MNKFKFLMYALVASMFVSCGGDEELPFVEFDGLGFGAFARNLDGPNGTYGGAFNFFDVAGSDASFTVEFVDEDNGRNVAEYSWTVAYDGGAPVNLLSIPSSQFTTGPNGLPSTSFSFSFQQALDALGLTIDDVDGGRFMDFQATVTKTDGSTFTAANTGADIVASAAFAGLFQHRANIICPSELEGTFDAVAMATGGVFSMNDTYTGTVRWEHEGNGVYQLFSISPDTGEEWIDASLGGYYGGYADRTQANLPLGDLRIVDACNVLSWSGASQWGELFSFTEVSTDGATLTLGWLNDYGEEATVMLTRTDGTDWPALSM